MPDDTGLEPDDQGEPIQLTKAQHDHLQAQARRSATLEEDALRGKQAERELAFLKAGVPADALASPLGEMFTRSYEGDLDVETVKAAATAVGLIAAAPEGETPPSETTATPEEQAATGERRDLAANATPHDGQEPVPDPRDAAVKIGRGIVDEGRTEEDGLGLAFRELIKAGASGDQRVLYDPSSEV